VALKVKKNTLVRLQYRMFVEEGEEIDSADADAPLSFVCGRGEVIQGLEREIMGMEPGQRRSFVVQPEDAYGRHKLELVRTLPRAGFPTDARIEKGQRFSYRSERGTELVEVCGVTHDTVTVDSNHPLAGKPLRYEVEVIDVQEETVDSKL
jgi:FKBP-type peptidyl-prolyl cis-trans isomerase SlyD